MSATISRTHTVTITDSRTNARVVTGRTPWQQSFDGEQRVSLRLVGVGDVFLGVDKVPVAARVLRSIAEAMREGAEPNHGDLALLGKVLGAEVKWGGLDGLIVGYSDGYGGLNTSGPGYAFSAESPAFLSAWADAMEEAAIT
jgi:hypothetical protein